MSAQSDLRSALRDILGPAARAHGYRGSAPTWRKSSALGDWAVINVQSSTSSTSDRLRCVVNLAFAPEPWLRWEAAHLGPHMPKKVSESIGLFRDRLTPAATDDEVEHWWEVSDDESATLAATAMAHQLEHVGWPTLETMFDRDRFASLLVARDGNGNGNGVTIHQTDITILRARALMLMDAGHSTELEALLREARDVPAESREYAERFEAWVRDQMSDR